LPWEKTPWKSKPQRLSALPKHVRSKPRANTAYALFPADDQPANFLTRELPPPHRKRITNAHGNSFGPAGPLLRASLSENVPIEFSIDPKISGKSSTETGRPTEFATIIGFPGQEIPNGPHIPTTPNPALPGRENTQVARPSRGIDLTSSTDTPQGDGSGLPCVSKLQLTTSLPVDMDPFIGLTTQPALRRGGRGHTIRLTPEAGGGFPGQPDRDNLSPYLSRLEGFPGPGVFSMSPVGAGTLVIRKAPETRLRQSKPGLNRAVRGCPTTCWATKSQQQTSFLDHTLEIKITSL